MTPAEALAAIAKKQGIATLTTIAVAGPSRLATAAGSASTSAFLQGIVLATTHPEYAAALLQTLPAEVRADVRAAAEYTPHQFPITGESQS